MEEEAEDIVNSIKQEIDSGDDSGLYRDTPRSWDSGVALDSVTALQMAEFQQVVDNLHRQVIQPNPQTQQQPPPPYPFKYSLNDGPPTDADNCGELEQIFLFPNNTYQGQDTGHKFTPLSVAAVQGCQSLPANGVIIQPKIVDKVEHKYISNQR